MRHFIDRENLGLMTARNVEINSGFNHILVTDAIMALHTVSMKEGNYLFPLYLYPTEQEVESGLYAADERRANLSYNWSQKLDHM